MCIYIIWFKLLLGSRVAFSQLSLDFCCCGRLCGVTHIGFFESNCVLASMRFIDEGRWMGSSTLPWWTNDPLIFHKENGLSRLLKGVKTPMCLSFPPQFWSKKQSILGGSGEQMMENMCFTTLSGWCKGKMYSKAPKTIQNERNSHNRESQKSCSNCHGLDSSHHQHKCVVFDWSGSCLCGAQALGDQIPK